MMRHRYLMGRFGVGFFSFWLLIAALTAFSTVALLDTSSVMAQDDELEPDAPADAAPAAAEDGSAQRGESRLAWMYGALGPFYSIVFLSLSFTLVALFVMNLLTARRENVVPVALVEGFESHLNEKRYQEAYEMAKADESFLGQVLSAGLAKLSAGYDQAIEAMQEVGEEENMKLEHRLSYMALIGTVSPMVGLLG
ncbi:MAG TPA: MotA/TolQ/ExbB proton channel family protein, partial [Thermoguttaceae bacterium]|nr:MotA/TolQ/ExbB proton channel family protein [Thermoguttaceae bacterium]